MLKISNYSVNLIESGKKIISNVNLDVNSGEIVVIIGANGSGKSSFAMSLLGLPEFKRSGSVKIDGIESIDLQIDEIAKLGLFVSFQTPPEIEGVSLLSFIVYSLRNLKSGKPISTFKIKKNILKYLDKLGLSREFLDRSVNLGFSGGEKRKSEILQLLMIKPKVAVLDEVDSGLDIASTQNIVKILRNLVRKGKLALIVISHNPLFIKKLNPDKLIELKNGRFVEANNEILDTF